jgi:hypothetical protein
VTPRQFVGLRAGQRAVDLGHDFACDRAQVERCQRNVAPRAVVLVFAGHPAAAAAVGRRDGLIPAFAVAVAIGVAAGRICPEIGCRSADSDNRPAGDIRIDPRPHSRIDARNARPDVEVGRAHDALRVNRRAVEIRERQCRCYQRQRRTLRLHPPIGTIVDHGTSGLFA